jgi:hypothetical protein
MRKLSWGLLDTWDAVYNNTTRVHTHITHVAVSIKRPLRHAFKIRYPNSLQWS